jgi:hypothetical protein
LAEFGFVIYDDDIYAVLSGILNELFMNFRGHYLKFLIIISISAGCFCSPVVLCCDLHNNSSAGGEYSDISLQVPLTDLSEETDKLNVLLKSLLSNADTSASRVIVGRLIKIINETTLSYKTLSESYFLIGTYNLIKTKYSEAIRYYLLAVSLKESNNSYDKRLANILYNLVYLITELVISGCTKIILSDHLSLKKRFMAN